MYDTPHLVSLLHFPSRARYLVARWHSADAIGIQNPNDWVYEDKVKWRDGNHYIRGTWFRTRSGPILFIFSAEPVID